MERILITNVSNFQEKEIKIEGWVYRIRKLKNITFLVIKDRSGLIQCIFDNEVRDLNTLKIESVISVVGIVKSSNNSLHPCEIIGNEFHIISEAQELPIEINKKELNINLDTILNNRILSIRHEKINSIFKIQNIVVQSFREFLINNDFTEIFTPKIVAEGTEGGTELFKVDYFGKTAYLAQSPQFYKQMMVGAGFERVFEVSHVYRAEEHNTSRHLNEYVSMDLEMGFINDEFDIVDLEEKLIKYMLKSVEEKGESYLEILEIEIPKIGNSIPRMDFSEAISVLKEIYGKENLKDDLDPESEKLICSYVKEKFNCDFIFLTNYPIKKRAMYTMPFKDAGSRSFDLLFKGVEITSGGERINNYNMLIESMRNKGLNPEQYENYTDIFKYGMPKHGGLAIGLERFTAQLLSLENIREASFITRDRTRITP